MTGNWFGKLFADKGCIAKWLTQRCQERGVELITSLIEHTRQRLAHEFRRIFTRRYLGLLPISQSTQVVLAASLTFRSYLELR
jgi:hypothetical protein